MMDQTITLEAALNQVINALDRPTPLDEVVQRVLAVRPSKAKNPVQQIRNNIRQVHRPLWVWCSRRPAYTTWLLEPPDARLLFRVPEHVLQHAAADEQLADADEKRVAATEALGHGEVPSCRAMLSSQVRPASMSGIRKRTPWLSLGLRRNMWAKIRRASAGPGARDTAPCRATPACTAGSPGPARTGLRRFQDRR